MKFSEQWLREWVNPELPIEELTDKLTMAGLELEGLEPVAPAFSGVVVGEVIKVEPHPDADKLRVCEVNIGKDEPLAIVCGAANVRAGLHVPTAIVGARLPGDFKIKKAKLRGVPSFGMLASASELGLAESSEGLMELPADSPVGEDFRQYLALDDVSIELGLTPNRGDCLSIGGVAREVGVLTQTPVEAPEMDEVPAECDTSFPVSIEAKDDCPRYVGRAIRGIDNSVETPMWMQERLRRSDIRSLGPLVDVTNYVLLELGQPMHAFDLGKLKDSITVRHASSGEKLSLLNESEVTLEPDVLVIADGNGAQAMAGVMGGSDTAVDDATTDIFLESAYFNPDSIAGRARRFGLHTDSSHRFERGVDPQLQRTAIERATTLLLAIVGGEAGPVVDVADESKIVEHPTVMLRHARIERVLGAEIDADRINDILARLEMSVEQVPAGWLVTPPSFRFDITIEEDLIEEVGRIVGYSTLPSHPPSGGLHMLARPEERIGSDRIRQLLVEQGYQEAITYSFIDPKIHQIMDPDSEAIALANPISSDLSVMRTTLWSGLVQALSYNLNRQQERIRLFESGLRFVKQGTEIKQDNMLAGLAYGPLLPEQWSVSNPASVDFFDVKGDLENLFELCGSNDFRFVAETHPVLHPGRSARIYRGEEAIGWFGSLHPAIEKKLGLPSNIYLFEIEYAAIEHGNVPNFREMSKYPAIRRDIAIVLDEQIPVDSVFDCVQQAAPDILQNLKLFDVYVGEHIDSGRKSLALGLTLQAQSRTLTDEEVDTAINNVLSRLETELGAKLRV